jgi:hypothetical protein
MLVRVWGRVEVVLDHGHGVGLSKSRALLSTSCLRRRIQSSVRGPPRRSGAAGAATSSQFGVHTATTNRPPRSNTSSKAVEPLRQTDRAPTRDPRTHQPRTIPQRDLSNPRDQPTNRRNSSPERLRSPQGQQPIAGRERGGNQVQHPSNRPTPEQTTPTKYGIRAR